MSASINPSSSSAHKRELRIDPTGFVKLGSQLPALANTLAKAINDLVVCQWDAAAYIIIRLST